MSALDLIYDLVIVGAGFSGQLTIHHLLKNSKASWRIAVIDSAPADFFGSAYATRHAEHLLNVRAAQMSAFPDAPNHFLDWLQSAAGQAALASYGQANQVEPHHFVPRAVYGHYLQSIKQQTDAWAKQAGHVIEYIQAHVSDIHAQNTHSVLVLSSHQTLKTAQLVLATGSLFSEASEDTSLVIKAWLYDFSEVHHHAAVAVIGTGLTAVDTMMSLLKSGYQGRIFAVSRHGRFPQPHTPLPLAAKPLTQEQVQALSTWPLSRVWRQVRQWIQQTDSPTQDWRVVIDSLRPHLQSIWQAWPVAQRKKFFQRCFGVWNIYRHRMAIEISEALESALASGKIEYIQGSFKGIEGGKASLKTLKGQRLLDVGVTFQCIGPSYTTLPACLNTLLQHQIITRHPTGAGLQTHGYLASGASFSPIYAMGALLIGERLETTAVPELRVQAVELAMEILAQRG